MSSTYSTTGREQVGQLARVAQPPVHASERLPRLAVRRIRCAQGLVDLRGERSGRRACRRRCARPRTPGAARLPARRCAPRRASAPRRCARSPAASRKARERAERPGEVRRVRRRRSRRSARAATRRARCRRCAWRPPPPRARSPTSPPGSRARKVERVDERALLPRLAADALVELDERPVRGIERQRAAQRLDRAVELRVRRRARPASSRRPRRASRATRAGARRGDRSRPPQRAARPRASGPRRRAMSTRACLSESPRRP